MTTSRLAARIARITLIEAQAYGATYEKWLWVCDNVLDPLDLPRTAANVEKVESAIEKQVALIAATFRT